MFKKTSSTLSLNWKGVARGISKRSKRSGSMFDVNSSSPSDESVKWENVIRYLYIILWPTQTQYRTRAGGKIICSNRVWSPGFRVSWLRGHVTVVTVGVGWAAKWRKTTLPESSQHPRVPPQSLHWPHDVAETVSQASEEEVKVSQDITGGDSRSNGLQ